MIWHRGEVVPDESVCVSVLDRTFEHGIGLFETFRTWNGHATLLSRHLERLVRSAGELDLSYDRSGLPDASSVQALVTANGILGAARLRITLSGGRKGSAGAPGAEGSLWMTAAPLPPTDRERGAVIDGTLIVGEGEPLADYKTLNYWRKGRTYDLARMCGVDDVLCVTLGGWLCETTRFNLFLCQSGRLITPGTDLPILPGVMRGLVLEQAARLGIDIKENRVAMDRLESVTEAFLTNSVRGIVPISRLMNHNLVAPGPFARRLWESIEPWLKSGGGKQ
jgi:branched-subunit amino acid aminotransferase/4-amino-4-deoxychorismate lyase